MQYTKLGSSGLTVSRLCLGTMTFGLQTDENSARAILDKAAGSGVNFIDTADAYPLGGDFRTTHGRTEEIVGRWLAGRREDFIVATKCAARMGPNPWDEGNSRKHVLQAIDASLKRLQTDYVDLYQLHSDDASTPLDETFETMDTVLRSGRARYVGVSNFLAWRVARAIGRCEVSRWTKPVSVQPRYNLLFREMERELFPLARQDKLAVIAYNPIAGGMLSGKHNPGTPPNGSRFTLGTATRRYQERYWHDRMFDTVDRLKGLLGNTGLALPTASVAWVLANPAVTSAIIGASRAEQLDATLASVELQFDPALKQAMDELTVEYRRGDAIM